MNGWTLVRASLRHHARAGALVAAGAAVGTAVLCGALAVGDSVLWDVQGVRVDSRVACIREVEWARFEPNFFVVFPSGPLDDAPHSYVLLSRVEDEGARARLQRSVVEAHPNVSTLDLAQVQRSIESVLDKVLLAVRFTLFAKRETGHAIAGMTRKASTARRQSAAAQTPSSASTVSVSFTYELKAVVMVSSTAATSEVKRASSSPLWRCSCHDGGSASRRA